MKILFMTNIPSPYRVDFFNELGKYCDLTVAFTDRFYAHRDKSWQDFHFDNFKGIFLKGKTWKRLRFCFDIKKVIKEGKFDKIICADFTAPTGMIAIRYMRKHKIPYWLESDGGFAKNGCIACPALTLVALRAIGWNIKKVAPLSPNYV